MINKPLIRPYFHKVPPGGGILAIILSNKRTANLSHVPLQVAYKILCFGEGELERDWSNYLQFVTAYDGQKKGPTKICAKKIRKQITNKRSWQIAIIPKT